MQIENKEITVKELLYKDIIELSDLEKPIMAKKLLLLATNLTEEEYEVLSIKNGLALQKEVNAINNLSEITENFQNPAKE